MAVASAAITSPDAAGEPARLVSVVGSLTVDRRARRVQLAGREIALTPKEFEVLTLLAEDPGAVVRREQSIDDVWDANW